MRVEHDLYFISMAARLLDMHPQTLRKYERLGLVRPTRTVGSMRVYSRDQLDRLKLIKHLVEDEGVNLAGIKVEANTVERANSGKGLADASHFKKRRNHSS